MFVRMPCPSPCRRVGRCHLPAVAGRGHGPRPPRGLPLRRPSSSEAPSPRPRGAAGSPKPPGSSSRDFSSPPGAAVGAGRGVPQALWRAAGKAAPLCPPAAAAPGPSPRRYHLRPPPRERYSPVTRMDSSMVLRRAASLASPLRGGLG